MVVGFMNNDRRPGLNSRIKLERRTQEGGYRVRILLVGAAPVLRLETQFSPDPGDQEPKVQVNPFNN
jgi:hypothetical protein